MRKYETIWSFRRNHELPVINIIGETRSSLKSEQIAIMTHVDFILQRAYDYNGELINEPATPLYSDSVFWISIIISFSNEKDLEEFLSFIL